LHGWPWSFANALFLQEPHAKAVKELLAAQEAVAMERARLDIKDDEIKARRAELAAQVG